MRHDPLTRCERKHPPDTYRFSRCPEADAWLDRGIRQFEIEQPDFKAFMSTYSDGRWFVMFDDDRERTEEELETAVRKALGRDLLFEIITTGRWELAGRIAERYSAGRIFLVGDAAHQLPPTRGGYGANTGIDDAYNLAWKLERVLNSSSNATLLDTYSDERQPIGWLRHQQTFARPDYASWVGDALKDEPLYGNMAMELGQITRSTAIIGAGPELPPAAHPDEWKGQPGTRTPHIWIEKRGKKLSTIDLFTRDFTLITANPLWIEAATTAAANAKLTLKTIHVGQDVTFPPDHPFGVAFGTDFWRSIDCSTRRARRMAIEMGARRRSSQAGTDSATGGIANAAPIVLCLLGKPLTGTAAGGQGWRVSATVQRLGLEGLTVFRFPFRKQTMDLQTGR